MSWAAYLRVYLPAERVKGGVQQVPSEAWPSRVLVRGHYGVWHESTRNDAFAIDYEGRRYVCPRYPRLRMLEGLVGFRNAYPGPVGRVLVPEAVADRAIAELGRLRALHPGVRSHILTSSFYVPLRWFAAFDASERELVQGRAGLSIRYRTRRSAAVTRLQRAVRVLEGAGFDEDTVEAVSDLIRWMRSFPRDSVVELDYGGVVAFFSDGELATDESAAEVAASLEALADGDLEEAGERYAEAASRWAHAQSLTYAN